MCTLCDSTNINTIFEFVPNCLLLKSPQSFLITLYIPKEQCMDGFNIRDGLFSSIVLWRWYVPYWINLLFFDFFLLVTTCKAKSGERKLIQWNRVNLFATRNQCLNITIILIIIFINFNWFVTWWQWLFYMCTKYEIGY